MFNLQSIENKIKQSRWWQKAAITVDSHHCNTSGIMLTHHLQQVYDNIDTVFCQPEIGFYEKLFSLLRQLNIDKTALEKELKIVALLHDIGKTEEDKSIIISHPLTGKPAHKRHGLVSLLAAMEMLAAEFSNIPVTRNRIFRTIELHDMSYGLYRQHQVTNVIPACDQWTNLNNKIHTEPAAGLMYLLIFKLADIHGHDNIMDVIWFYHTAKANYFDQLKIELPLPTETDIR